MREILIDLREVLMKGLRPEPSYTLNVGVLEDVVGFVTNVYGLSKKDWTELHFDSIQNSFPFPQLVKAGGSLFIGTASHLYDSEGNLIDVEVAPGGSWHGASFGVGYILTNGSCVILNYSGEPKVYDKHVIDVVEHKGRMVFGGLGNFIGQRFNTLLSMLTGRFFEDLDERSVYWSSVGGWDLPIHFDNQCSESTLKEYLERNDSGYLKLDGNIVRLLELGDDLVAYTDKGIWMLRPVITPFPSYTSAKISDHSVVSAGGWSGQHFFVTEDHILYSLSGDGIRKMGYKEFIYETPLVSYDQGTGTLFLGMPQYSLVFRNKAMTKINEVVTSAELGKVLISIK